MTSEQQVIFEAMRAQHGAAHAARWWQSQQERVSYQEQYLEHESHVKASELLEPHREALGPAYDLLHLLARWSVENASENDPAPHLMTTYWTLEEITGQSERNLRRHLVESLHRWSETVAHLIDVDHNYGERLDGKDEKGADKTAPCITNMVIRFFPRGRQGKQARVKRWGKRDLLAESDEGRTRGTRQHERVRYRRYNSQLSAHSPVVEQGQENNWLLVRLGQSVSYRVENHKRLGNLYADIPKNHVLHALREDLRLSEDNAIKRGANVKRARSKWVDTAAQVLAARHGDDKPLPCHAHERYITHADGFTDLWRKTLWTAVAAEMYGGTQRGWKLVQDVIERAAEAQADGLHNPSAYAFKQVKEDVEVLRREYGNGAVGAMPA